MNTTLLSKEQLIQRIQEMLDIQKLVMLEQNGRPDCKNCSLAETLQDLLDSQISESVSPDYELKYCEDHGTMTNHLNGVCQKGQNDE